MFSYIILYIQEKSILARFINLCKNALFTFLLLSDNASLRTLYEVDNILNLLGNLKILLDFLDTFLQYTLAVE